MKKSERLNQELIFLNYRKTFHLKDLMDEFHISKCTALRDIQELEEIGLSVYSDLGRNGKYHIISQHLLTPIYFNEDETTSILFAIKALEKLTQTPFDKTWPQIYQKLMASLPDANKDNITNLLSNIYYRSVPAVAKTNYLRELMLAANEETLLDLEYRQRDIYKKCIVYVLDLFFQDGTWFFNGYDPNEKSWSVFRCDHIISCCKHQSSSAQIFANKNEARRNLLDYKAEHQTFSFRCALTPFGKELFLKSDYYGMTLNEENGRLILSGKIETYDKEYLIQYLISFGENITILSPDSLVKEYLNALDCLKAKYF